MVGSLTILTNSQRAWERLGSLTIGQVLGVAGSMVPNLAQPGFSPAHIARQPLGPPTQIGSREPSIHWAKESNKSKTLKSFDFDHKKVRLLIQKRS